MNIRRPLSLALGLTLASASALTVTGMVQGGVTPETRIGGFAVTPFGQPVQELVSASLSGGKFRLDVPTGAPSGRAQAVLTPQNVSWPGVTDPVQISAAAFAGELKFFTYRDLNGNERHDDNEALTEATVMVGKAALFIPWVSADVMVTANKGYLASLRKGWNAVLVEVGRTVNVQPYPSGTEVVISVGR
ncbi:hypothetical protein [Deinococcus frigens]|uniref:hypothetical protein n=1 Tax=Deinococcus frigens TaxID=249403 RepID=UPI0004983DBA|nr:hypothetical protein [Deinococcus frigens]